jgi:hypothetical protein
LIAAWADGGVTVQPELDRAHTNYLKQKENVVTLGALKKQPWRTAIEYCAGYGHTDYSLLARAMRIRGGERGTDYTVHSAAS